MGELNRLRTIRIFEEPADQHAVDNSANPEDFAFLAAQVDGIEPAGNREVLDPNTARMQADQRDLQVLGNRACQVGFTATLHSHGRDLDGSVEAPTLAEFPLGLACKVSMGGFAATPLGPGGEQSEVEAGSTETVIQLIAGHGARFRRGDAIGVQTLASGSQLEVREVASVDGDAITLREALSSVPTVGTFARGAFSTHLTECPENHLQAIVEGRQLGDGFVYCGLNGGFSVELPVGGLGSMSFDLAGSFWRPLGSSSRAIPAYQSYRTMLCSPLEAHLPLFGSAQPRVALANSAVTFEPQHTYEAQRSGLAPESVAKMVRQSAPPAVRATITFPFEGPEFYQARDSRELRSLFLQAGNIPGRIVYLTAPRVQITDVQPAEVDGGIRGQVVTVEALIDTPGTAERDYSASRIHWL